MAAVALWTKDLNARQRDVRNTGTGGMDQAERVAAILPEVTEWRRHLHRHPELSFAETETAAFVADRLRAFGCDGVETGIGRTGVVATIKGRRGASGRSIAIRADMDALPITETTNLPYRSTVPGRMHACGHDGHTAVLLGAARHLAQTRDFDGTVTLVFQPAEEGGAGGARAMIADGLFERFPVDEVYGLHSWPGIPVGRFALCEGPLLASFDGFTVTVEGVGGHAATPEKAVDTVVVLAHIVTALQAIVARNIRPQDPVVISTCTIHAGEANNILPQTGTLTGSVRALTEADRDLCEARMRRTVEGVAATFGATAALAYNRTLPVTVNDRACARNLARAAAGVVGSERVDAAVAPKMGAEDFAFLSAARPGAFILLGNGDSADLHNPGYDFNDESARYGVGLWARLVGERLL